MDTISVMQIDGIETDTKIFNTLKMGRKKKLSTKDQIKDNADEDRRVTIPPPMWKLIKSRMREALTDDPKAAVVFWLTEYFREKKWTLPED